MQVFFNYQKSGCGTGTGTLSQFKTGVDPIANAADGGGDTGADFALVEMQQVPSTIWNAYYSGWDASGTAPSYGMGIHHPSGDYKKISRAGTVVSGTWAIAGYHWRVSWVQTETNWGVTEPGSSGSPLFNQNHQLIGTLTGGGSYCDTPTANDFYGKFSKQWNHANNTNSTSSANYWNMPTHMLQPWLDPNNTGATSMGGSYKVSGSCIPAVVSIPELSFDRTSIYPTLASENVTITTQEFERIQNVKVYDSRGMLIDTFRLSGDKTEVNVSGYAAGVYYVSFLGTGGDHLTQKFTVIR
jgi:hypothetical protein